MKWIAVMLFLTCSSARAEEWSQRDVTYEGVFQTLLFVDFATTMYLNQPGMKVHEVNPFLSPHPSKASFAYWFLGVSASHFLITNFTSGEVRKFWLSGTIMVEGLAVSNNMLLVTGVF